MAITEETRTKEELDLAERLNMVYAGLGIYVEKSTLREYKYDSAAGFYPIKGRATLYITKDSCNKPYDLSDIVKSEG